MRLFHCTHCGSLVFFDSSECLACGSALAFDPERLEMMALQPATDDPTLWERLNDVPGSVESANGSAAAVPAPASRFRMCANREAHNACNFAIPCHDVPQAAASGEPSPAQPAPMDGRAGGDAAPDGSTPAPVADAAPMLCVSCEQTRILPDLSDPDNVRRWTNIEIAKRRLYYSLAQLDIAQIEGEPGPVYEFKADTPEAPVMTGHDAGVITLNVAEADDDERTRRRIELGEPYRTLLGHLRHESGHYYWDVLVLRGGHVDAYREVFGDERADYGEALKAHYASAPHTGWQNDFISDYATSHPWEDWAETWAHYLHMVDLLETAQSYRTEVAIPGPLGEPRYAMVNPFTEAVPDFDAMMQAWVPLTLLLNSLNRSLGQLDAYPFAMGAGVKEKLRFVHALVNGQLTPVTQPVQEDTQQPAATEAPPLADAPAPADAADVAPPPMVNDAMPAPAMQDGSVPAPAAQDPAQLAVAQLNDGPVVTQPVDGTAPVPAGNNAPMAPEPALQK